MSKETEKRLIRTLEFLKEPHGSTIPTLVKAMNIESPQLSLKRIVQTLRGCVENGILKVADGRIKLKQVSPRSETIIEKKSVSDEIARPKSGCGNPCPKPCPPPPSQKPKPCAKPGQKLPTKPCPKPSPKPCSPSPCSKPKSCSKPCQKPKPMGSKPCGKPGSKSKYDSDGGHKSPHRSGKNGKFFISGKEGVGSDAEVKGDATIGVSACKSRPKCSRPKGRSPRARRRCSRPKPRCPKSRPKCPKSRPKCPKSRPRRSKKSSKSKRRKCE